MASFHFRTFSRDAYLNELYFFNYKIKHSRTLLIFSVDKNLEHTFNIKLQTKA